MALDTSALKAKLAKFNRVGSNRSESLWRPTEGKTIVRIVPWKDRPEFPFIELQFHYLGNKTYLSPTTHGRKDPIAEFAESLMGSRSSEEYQLAKPFLPKMRTYVPVIVRGEEDKGVRYWAFGKTVYKQLLEMIDDPDIGDITHPKTGRDITVAYVPQDKSDTNFAKTTVMYKPNSTPLSDDADLAKQFLNDQPDVYSLYDEPSYAELKGVLEAYLDPDATGATPPDETSSDTDDSPSVTVSKKTPKAAKESVDEALEDFEKAFSDL